MNCITVHILQIILIVCFWLYFGGQSKLHITKPMSLDVLVARFVGSMLMHFNVEKDVRHGLIMMKYAVNH